MDFIKLSFLDKDEYKDHYIGEYFININQIRSIKLRKEHTLPNIIGGGTMIVPETITISLCENEENYSINQNDIENKEAYKILKTMISSPLKI